LEESPEGYNFDMVPVGSSTTKAIQSGLEYAMLQNSPVTTVHLLFGVIMTDNCAGQAFLKDLGVTVEQIMDSIPEFLPDQEPPF